MALAWDSSAAFVFELGVAASPTDVVTALYVEFLERGLHYFFPGGQLQITGAAETHRPALTFLSLPDGSLEMDWFGLHYRFGYPGKSFTENQVRLLVAIGGLLSARFRSIFNAASAATSFQLFRGLPEDRFVSAFLDPFIYLDENALPTDQDVIADAIEVLRESSLITYENRRISTGALLLGSKIDPHHLPPPLPSGALCYNSALTSIKSFHRLCNGLQTVFLVNGDGMMVDLIDIRDWSNPCAQATLPAPSSSIYRAHSVATLCGGHICLVLTPNGEIKIFAEGAQLFNFLGGKWRLSDLAEKYRVWEDAVGDPQLAERLFISALDLAETRHGGLFVVLDDPQSVTNFVAAGDLLSATEAHNSNGNEGSTKDQIHYLLRHKRILDLAPSLVETIAGMDGATVIAKNANLLAFGAILQHHNAAAQAREGGRTTAAIGASQFGNVLKISEDGLVTFYRQDHAVWEI